MHGWAPWKTEETIVGLPRLLVLSVLSRFGGCHLSPFLSQHSTPGYNTCWRRETVATHPELSQRRPGNDRRDEVRLQGVRARVDDEGGEKVVMRRRFANRL